MVRAASPASVDWGSALVFAGFEETQYRRFGHEFVQNLQPLRVQPIVEAGFARHVATRASKAFDKTVLDGV